MILNDKQISSLGNKLITPFSKKLVSSAGKAGYRKKIISYGLSSFGYDLRLKEVPSIQVFRADIPSTSSMRILDPKNFNLKILGEANKHEREGEVFYILPPKSTALLPSLERIKLPNDIKAVTYCKSTYSRSGLVIPPCVAEPGWEGVLTITIINTLDIPVKIYANEGIVQLCFYKGEEVATDYKKREGKYNNAKAVEVSK